MCAKSVGCPLKVEDPRRISELPLLPLADDAGIVSGEPVIFDLSPVVESGKSVRRRGSAAVVESTVGDVAVIVRGVIKDGVANPRMLVIRCCSLLE